MLLNINNAVLNYGCKIFLQCLGYHARNKLIIFETIIDYLSYLKDLDIFFPFCRSIFTFSRVSKRYYSIRDIEKLGFAL
jgi:hypothetical protein